jgi:hypothetical protein
LAQDGDKIVRLEGQSAVIEAGHVLIPESAPWLGDFLGEILAFPQPRESGRACSVSVMVLPLPVVIETGAAASPGTAIPRNGPSASASSAMDSFSSRSPEPSLRSWAQPVQTRLTAYRPKEPHRP